MFRHFQLLMPNKVVLWTLIIGLWQPLAAQEQAPPPAYGYQYRTPVVTGELPPLLIFLHGSGERGEVLKMVDIHGPIKYMDTVDRTTFPFALLSPQCPQGEWWDPERLDQLLDKIIAMGGVDTQRIYVTGLSMGGYGTWDWALKRPDRFAAIIPICGGDADKAAAINRLKDMPIWAFHGAKDNVVSIELTDTLIQAARATGNPEVKYTVYPEAGHDSWTETYANPEVYQWLLEHKKAP